MGPVHHYPALNRPADPVCSVCIANYNGVAMLGDCLESVLAQQGNISVEIIVHDDASTDDSVAYLRARYPKVELLASEQNVGFCISNNRMVAHARGKYVLLLNNDAALYPDALTNLLEAALQQKSAGILTLPQYDWATGLLVDRGCLLDPFYNPIPNLDPGRTDVAMAIGACLWIPRSLWNELGGFPEWMESIAEDLYLCCLARSRSIAVQVSTDSGFRHRLGASFGGARIEGKSLKSSFRRRRLSERNKTFALVIFTPAPAMWILLTIHIITLLLEGLIVSAARMNHRIFLTVYLNVPLALMRDQKNIRALRRKAQDARTASARTFFHAFSLLPRKLTLLLRFGIPRITK
ncbi:MAG: glycosyltransferase [Rhodanobacter sp.]